MKQEHPMTPGVLVSGDVEVISEERAAFEAWFFVEHNLTKLWNGRSYDCSITQGAWIGWQAKAKRQAAPAPAEQEVPSGYVMVLATELECALDCVTSDEPFYAARELRDIIAKAHPAPAPAERVGQEPYAWVQKLPVEEHQPSKPWRDEKNGYVIPLYTAPQPSPAQQDFGDEFKSRLLAGLANAENYFGETHEFFDAQDNLIALVDVAAVKPGRMTPAEELAALKAQGFRDGRDSMAGFIPVPKNALRDFIEYSVHGPYGSDEKWLADKKTLVSAALSYPQPSPAERVEQCDTCHGQGEVFTGDHHYHGQFDPPEPIMELCPECSGEAPQPSPAPNGTNGTTGDKYRAELYDEVWQAARGMGYGNVTEALEALSRKQQSVEMPEPAAFVQKLPVVFCQPVTPIEDARNGYVIPLYDSPPTTRPALGAELDAEQYTAHDMADQAQALRDIVAGLVEALKDITDDYEGRFDIGSPSTNPGIKIVVAQARAALSAHRQQEGKP